MVIVIGIQKVSLGEQGIFCGTSPGRQEAACFGKVFRSSYHSLFNFGWANCSSP